MGPVKILVIGKREVGFLVAENGKNTGELWYFEFYKSYTSTGMNFSAVSL